MAVELQKGQKVNLEKKSAAPLGEVLINLNWNQGTPQKKGLFSMFSGKKGGVDLDLGCLFEMQDGRKGCVQALGNAFGSLTAVPYVALDGDDRTGAVTTGENLRINGGKLSEIKRVLIYTFIYEGAANWQQVDGIVTVKCPGSEDIIVRMDEYNSPYGMCGIALLENVNNETLSVEKVVQFFPSHPELDQAFHWGLQWKAGKK